MSLDNSDIRLQFPTLLQEVNHRTLVYLDSAATSQKPNRVIERTDAFYRNQNAAVHRGVHHLSAKATEMMEDVRDQVKTFLNAANREEIVFTHGTTHAINLVANSFGQMAMGLGDEVIITEMEHHANIVPWQLLEKSIGIKVVVWRVESDGTLNLDTLRDLLSDKTKLLALTHISNVLGTVNPVKEIIELAQINGTKTLIDGAQAVMHQRVDVQALGCDFYVFSGHKIYGPTGIGVMYGRKELLDMMPPWEGGGAMIEEVSLTEETTFNSAPWRFEAGSPNVAGVIGLGEAISFVEEIGFDFIQRYESNLMASAIQRLSQVPDLQIYGSLNKSGVLAFNLGDLHPYDVGSFLDRYGVAIRTGHHCAMPLMKRYRVPGMCRASFAIYNNKEDIKSLCEGLERVHALLLS
ncbi:cysteine desulfurase CsdA [Veronia nyctiphanis]|uniref:Cysteine desulfurase n=1 Tax=Veronia nyctiphanis TaxID=1278244 RepID=A0A4Q0YLY5_9GAMM|nr:SufS family cysteine desulfurase [Veronia nyctiphanis]RXJ71706.1 cysteine desulfurase CsdA [Veronia nyctiphanis]